MLCMALGESLTAISLLHAKDTVKGVTGAVAESEAGVCLALLVQTKQVCKCPLPLTWIGHLAVQLECV